MKPNNLINEAEQNETLAKAHEKTVDEVTGTASAESGTAAEPAVDNLVKINFTFRTPATDLLKEALGDADNGVKIEGRLRDLLGAELLDIARRDNPDFSGRFQVTSLGETLEGMYDSDSMVRTSVESRMLEALQQGLRSLSGSQEARADINLSCAF